MKRRHEYSLNLSAFEQHSPSTSIAHLELRPARPADSSMLSELMIEAYRGTIDYDGETIDDAIREVEAYLAGERGGRPLLNESRLAFAGTQLVSACLVGEWRERQLPLIAYVMTHAAWKNQGVGKLVLSAVLQVLCQRGYRQVRAVITEGNVPSERLFDGTGFRKVNQTVEKPSAE